MSFAGLRIGLVGPLPPPAGGMANQTRQLAELLRSEGASVELVQTNAPYRPAFISRVSGIRALARLVPYLVQLWRVARKADVMHVMANSGWSWHLFAAPAIWVSSLCGTPVVVNYRGGEAGTFLARSARVVAVSLRRVADLVFPSGYLQAVFDAHGMHGHIVPNIIDLSRFKSAGEMRAVPPQGGHIVVARNLEHIYGIDIALRAFAQLVKLRPAARLSIAGSGPERQALMNLAEKLGVSENVSFTGRLDRDQMAALYRDADLMLNPTRVDNMPNSVLEALASGVPVVTTDVGGIPYIVKHGETALLVPADDALSMSTALARALDDAELSRQMRARGLQEVRQYSWEHVKAAWLDVYSRAIAARAG